MNNLWTRTNKCKFPLNNAILFETHCLYHCFPRYEKMISGKYLGEVARRVILQCSKSGLLFNNEDRLSAVLKTPGAFQTKYLSEIERLNFYLTVS